MSVNHNLPIDGSLNADKSSLNISSHWKFWLPVWGLSAVAYVVLGRLCLELGTIGGTASPFWLPAGLVMALSLQLGYRVLPGIFLGEFILSFFFMPGPLPKDLLISIGNVLEGAAVVFISPRLMSNKNPFQSVRNFFAFFAASAIGSSINALLGVTSLWLYGMIPLSLFGSVMLNWSIGDIGGALIIAPLIFSMVKPDWSEWRGLRAIEFALLLLVSSGLTYIIFSDVFNLPTAPLAFLLLPVLLWPAFRLGLASCAMTNSVVMAIAIWGTARGYGPFIAGSSIQSLVLIQLFTSVVIVTSLLALIANLSIKANSRELQIAATAFETLDGIMITDANANIIRVNRAFEKITGYSAQEVVGKNPRILNSGKHDRAFYTQMWLQLSSTGAWSGEIWDKHKIGNLYPKQTTITAVKNSEGKTTQYVAIFADITERKKSELDLYHLAFSDPLTGLPNRRLLTDQLRAALLKSSHDGQYGAILFIDLDKFKIINDTMGSIYGDMVLTEVAFRIKQCLGELDTLARFNADEFLILIENIGVNEVDATQHIALIAENIRLALEAPYLLGKYLHHSSSSIGVCLFCGDGTMAEELIKRADIAMYEAKNSGRNRVCFFDPQLQQTVEAIAALENDLRQAIEKKQLQLFYQIQVNQDKQPVGAEALVRWNHPQRGIVSPLQFIPIAEDSTLILDIGQWILDAGCLQIAAWNQYETTKNLTLALNISASQFQQVDFVAQVKFAIDKHHIEPSRLKLELTESVALGDIDVVVEKMYALRHDVGVQLSLDDFGTGYSSLSYLKRLPLDQVKIDQSFVRHMTSDTGDAVMVKTIIDLAHNFSLDVIAEGVETDDHLDCLQKYGCKSFQGYLFSKPLPLESFEVLLGIDSKLNELVGA